MDYDLIIVGGGLGGSALAKSMAERGPRVLVCEREQRFRDRIRGEGMHAWGVTEARALGLYDALRHTCTHEARYWTDYQDATLLNRRDLVETTTHRAGCLNFYHPAMQEALIHLAADAGADVRRRVTVTQVSPGARPTVSLRERSHCPDHPQNTGRNTQEPRESSLGVVPTESLTLTLWYHSHSMAL